MTDTAIILAAGRGERLRPITDVTPKSMLQVGRHRLIEYAIDSLRRAGVVHIVINVAWLADQIIAHLGDGTGYGVHIRYSHESEGALETAGGIVRALPLLNRDRFIVHNADVWSDFDLSQLRLSEADEADLVLVANPAHHPQGDFSLRAGRVQPCDTDCLTFAGIGLYRARLFEQLTPGVRALSGVLQQAARAGCLRAHQHRSHWHDVGTPERLQVLRQFLQAHEG